MKTTEWVILGGALAAIFGIGAILYLRSKNPPNASPPSPVTQGRIVITEPAKGGFVNEEKTTYVRNAEGFITETIINRSVHPC